MDTSGANVPEVRCVDVGVCVRVELHTRDVIDEGEVAQLLESVPWGNYWCLTPKHLSMGAFWPYAASTFLESAEVNIYI